jgi:hypothetical protein
LNTFDVNTVYPFWWIIFCALGGIIYAAFLYWYKNNEWKEVSKSFLYFLSFLRFSVVGIVLFLLLEPFVKNTYYTDVPANIVILQDNSQSIALNKDSIYYKQNYPKTIKKITEELSAADYLKVKFLTFGNSVFKNDDSLSFDKPYTNIYNALKETEELYSGQNLSAVILLSDGIFNRGQNPLYWTNTKNTKLYTVALGDTSLQRDALVENIFSNDLVLLSNDFEVKYDLKFKQLSGKSAKVEIIHNGKTEFSKKYTIKNNNYTISESVILNAAEPGWQQYTIKIEPFENEISLKNNSKTFFVKVIDSRNKVLLLAASPNPDIAAIKRATDKNKNIELKVVYQDDFNESLLPYSLIILHQIPVNTTNTILVNKLKQAQKNIWFITGTQTNAIKFNSLGLKEIPSTAKFNYVLPALNNNFNLFNISADQAQLLKRVAPVLSPFGQMRTLPGESVLLNQKIGQVETNYPLFSFYSLENTKYAYFIGEGLWRWRMLNFELSGNFNSFDDLVNNTIEYLSVKQDKSLLQISVKHEWNENENITFYAKLFNPAYELITTSDIDLTITNSNNESFKYKMLKGDNDYYLEIGSLPVGIYSYLATTTINNQKVTASGKFIVKEIALESINTQANYELLKKLAEKNSGEFFQVGDINKITAKILNDSGITATLEEQKDYQPLIYYKWIALLLLFLVSLEWFIRKWHGNV